MGCRLWGRTEADTTEATEQQQQQPSFCLSDVAYWLKMNINVCCLEKSMDRGAWWATVLGVGCKESGTTLCVSLNITIFACLNIKRNIRKE